jgi:hypothetical protein
VGFGESSPNGRLFVIRWWIAIGAISVLFYSLSAMYPSGLLY